MSTDRPRSYNLGDLFELVASAVPDRLCIAGGGIRYTFGEFDRRTNQVAQMLIGVGCEPGAKVAVYAWNRVEWAELFFGSFKARVVPINVNYRYVAHELEYLFDNSDSEVVIFERGFAPVIDEIRSKMTKVRSFLVIEVGTDHPTPWAKPYEELSPRRAMLPSRTVAVATTSTSSTPVARQVCPRA